MSTRVTTIEQRSLVTFVNDSAIERLANEQVAEKHELQTLNNRLSTHVLNVKELEEQNQILRKTLDELKNRSGFDSAHIKDQYDDKLQSLRKKVDDSSNEKSREELIGKRVEFDTNELKRQIDLVNQLNILDSDRLVILRQQQKSILHELKSIQETLNIKIKERREDQETYTNLQANLKQVRDLYEDEGLRRVMLENEIQSIEEQIAFMKVIFEEEKNELLGLGVAPVDVENFYSNALIQIMRKIEEDFKRLAEEQKKTWDHYYAEKTAVSIRQIEEQHKFLESERDRQVSTRSSNIPAMEKEILREQEMQSELFEKYQRITAEVTLVEEQIEEIATRSNREFELQEHEEQELVRAVQELEAKISGIIDGNISLKSEINVYRRLLAFEDAPPPPQKATEEIRTMTVQKQAQGNIVIDQVDPEGNFIVIENNGVNNREQDMTNWSIKRTVDGNEELTFRFPNGCLIQPRSRVRILARDAPQTGPSQLETLIANNVPNWRSGLINTTKLFDSRNIQKALFKQSFS